MFTRTAAAAGLALLIPATALAGASEEILTIGDPAPSIDAAHWLKGRPLTAFEPGHVYVIELWATWCAPCRAVMPHLSELQQQYRDYDVHFIGISDEKLATVVKFLCNTDSESTLWYDNMRYAVATDPDRSVHDDYMVPAGRLTIPTTIIVGKDGRIDWIGNPHIGFDEALARVVRNDWDRDAYRAAYEREVAPVRESLRRQHQIDDAVARGDWNAAIAAVESLPAESEDRGRLELRLYRQMLKAEAAPTREFGHRLMEAGWDDAGVLNGLGWYTAISESRARDLDFAVTAARRACEVTDWANGGIIDTLARAYFEKGQVGEAVKWQRKAVEQARSDDEAKSLRDTLIEYEKAAAGR